MDGLFHGKAYEQIDDLGFSHIFGNTHLKLEESEKLDSSCMEVRLMFQALWMWHFYGIFGETNNSRVFLFFLQTSWLVNSVAVNIPPFSFLFFG